jgi:hypothetical protein
MSCLYCAVSNATASSLLGISSAISPKCTGAVSGKSQFGSFVLIDIEQSLYW